MAYDIPLDPDNEHANHGEEKDEGYTYIVVWKTELVPPPNQQEQPPQEPAPPPKKRVVAIDRVYVQPPDGRKPVKLPELSSPRRWEWIDKENKDKRCICFEKRPEGVSVPEKAILHMAPVAYSNIQPTTLCPSYPVGIPPVWIKACPAGVTC